MSDLTQEEAKALLERVKAYQRDPLFFCKEVMGEEKHWAKQVKVLQALARGRRVAVRSGHGVGKSYVAADAVLWFIECFAPAIVITTAPTWRQVEKILWGEVAEHYSRSKHPLGGQILKTELRFGPKWYAMGFSSDKPDNFQGYHQANVLIIVDEPSGIPDEIFHAIEGTLSNKNAKLLLIGNPIRDTGYFADAFKSPLFEKIHISCLESPNVIFGEEIIPGLTTRKWVEEMKEEWGEDSSIYKSRVLGDFPGEGADTLIRLDWIEKAKQRYIDNKMPTTGYCVLGVDVARFGDDFTVLVTRKGARVIDIESYQNRDTMHTVSRIRSKIDQFGVDDVVIDDNGVGGGVTDRLRELQHDNIIPIIGGGLAEDSEKFQNRKSELAWRARKAFEDMWLEIPAHEKLEFECSNQYYDNTSKDKMTVMSKTLLRKKGLKSPDFFEALSYTFAKEYTGMTLQQRTQYKKEFYEFVHVREIHRDALRVGTTWYMTLVPNINGESYALWYSADKLGYIYFYRELPLDRATSSLISKRVKEKEEQMQLEPFSRYILKVPLTKEVKDNTFTLADQFGEEGLWFQEIEYEKEQAGYLIREGLSFDKDKPLSKNNLPHIFISPECRKLIRAIKYYMDGEKFDNEDFIETVHAALGLSILSEPVWVPRSQIGV